MGRGGPGYTGGPLPEIHYIREKPDEVYAYCPDWKNAHYGLARLGPKYNALDPFTKFDDPPPLSGIRIGTPGVSAFTGFVATAVFQHINKKPALSQIWKHLGFALVFGIAGELAWRRTRYNAAIRDAITQHYIQLHPEDFPEIERKKVGHLLRNWAVAR